MALDKIVRGNYAMHPPNFKVYSYWYNVLVDAINNASTTLEQATTGIIAFATGGQASATQLTTYYNNITTCDTAKDSVKLPTAAISTVCIVKNNGAASLDVFPYTDDAINALAANLAITIPVGAEVKFVAIDTQTWYTNSVTLVLSSPSTQKGALVIKAADSAGETTTTIINASQSGARTYTIPDAGGNANFMMESGTTSAKTITTVNATTLNTVSCKLTTPLVTTGVGTVVVNEYGDGRDMTTVCTLTNFIVGTIPGAGNLAVGNIFAIYPAGNHLESVYYSNLNLTIAGTTVSSKLGIGSVIGTGVVTVLNGTPTFMDRTTEQTVSAQAGGGAYVETLVKVTAGVFTGIGLNVTGSVKNIFLNAAGAWNANNAGNLTANGTITLRWTKMGA